MLLGAGIAFGSDALIEQREISASTPDSSAQLQEKRVTTPPVNSSLIPNNFVTEVVDTVGDSVVRIDASRQTGRFRMSEGTGSGFVVSKDGQILTNAHVVDGN